MKKIICVIMFILFIFNTPIMVSNAERIELNSKSAVLMDAQTGRVLYGKNADCELPMASTTKIMTLIVTLENANLEDAVEVSAYAASMPDVQLNIRKGEHYFLKDLCYSLMLESHNDSAVAIAEHVGGSVEKFAEMMNRKAKEIGCNHAFFITPNGLDQTTEKDHSISAEDLAKIMAYCVTKSPQKEKFIEITRSENYCFENIEKTRSFSCINHNAFLHMMNGVISGKTGFTGKAGYCYTAALKRGDAVYTIALLGCGWPPSKGLKWKDAKKLFDYGINNYKYEFINITQDEPSIIVKNCTDENGFFLGDQKIKLRFDHLRPMKLLINKEEKVKKQYNIPEMIDAPVKKGQEIGSVSYILDEKVIEKRKLLADEKIDGENGYKNIINVIKIYFLSK